jgi:hypothetical protein
MLWLTVTKISTFPFVWNTIWHRLFSSYQSQIKTTWNQTMTLTKPTYENFRCSNLQYSIRTETAMLMLGTSPIISQFIYIISSIDSTQLGEWKWEPLPVLLRIRSLRLHITIDKIVDYYLRLLYVFYVCIYRMSQEECARLRESVPYAKLYRYNPKHLYPKLNGYEIMAGEFWNFDSCYSLIDYQIPNGTVHNKYRIQVWNTYYYDSTGP